VPDEDADELEVAAGGGRMQGRPLITVLGIHIRPVLQQELQHLDVVVDARLMHRRQSVLIGCIRRDSVLQEGRYLGHIVA